MAEDNERRLQMLAFAFISGGEAENKPTKTGPNKNDCARGRGRRRPGEKELQTLTRKQENRRPSQREDEKMTTTNGS